MIESKKQVSLKSLTRLVNHINFTLPDVVIVYQSLHIPNKCETLKLLAEICKYI